MDFNEMRNRSQKPENRWQGVLLSLDPGHTTGYALWCCSEDKVTLMEAGQLTTWDKVDIRMEDFVKLINAVKIKHAVFETYQVYEWKSADHSWSQVPTIQIIGATKILCQQKDITYSSQTAQVAKQFCTDDKLEKWGLYKPGMKHARDAIRHGCYYILFGNRK